MTTTNGSARPVVGITEASNSILGDLEGGRAAPRPNPEVVARAKRRRYSAEFKQKILAEADAAKGSGEVGAVLRRNGLYSSHLVKWRRERAAGIAEGLAPQKRGPKAKANPLAEENRKLRHDMELLADRLRKAEIVIDVQKNERVRLRPPTCWTRNSEAGTVVRREEWPSSFWCSRNP